MEQITDTDAGHKLSLISLNVILLHVNVIYLFIY